MAGEVDGVHRIKGLVYKAEEFLFYPGDCGEPWKILNQGNTTTKFVFLNALFPLGIGL